MIYQQQQMLCVLQLKIEKDNINEPANDETGQGKWLSETRSPHTPRT